MPDWVRALLGVGAFTGFALLVRWWLIAKVTLWSLQADENGREHALKLLRRSRASQMDRPKGRRTRHSLAPVGMALTSHDVLA